MPHASRWRCGSIWRTRPPTWPNSSDSDVEHAGDQDDRRAGRHAGVIGDQQAGVAARTMPQPAAISDHQRDVARPEARGRGRQHHEPDRQQRAERVEAGDEVEHDQRQEREMRRRAGAADRAQEARIDAFDHQRPIDQRQHDQRDRGDAGDQQQRLVVERQHRPEQHVQQIDIGALHRDDGDAERQRDQVEGGERGVLLQLGHARDEAGEQRDHASRRSGRRRSSRTGSGRRPGSRSPRPAGSRAPWRRRPGSCGAASGTRRSGRRRAPARACRPARGA